MATKWLEDKLTNGEVITEDDIKRLLKDFTGKGKTKPESNVFDFKEEFIDGAEGKCKLTKSLVEFANGSGGVLIYGVDDNSGRIGCPEELADRLDPARIQDILDRYIGYSGLRLITCGVQWYQFYVAIIVYPSTVPIVFERDGEYHRRLSSGGTRPVIEFSAGTICVRDGARSKRAQQHHISRLVERAANERARLLVRRFEQVAQLPPEAEIVAVPKGSNAGLKLVTSDEGIPVTVVEDSEEPAVPVRGIMTMEPFTRLRSEMMAQVRTYRTDNLHRVEAKVVTRWYLQLDGLEVPSQAAELAFLSTLKNFGFPMFWAASMDREALRETVQNLIQKSSWPEVQQLPHVIAAFFWDERSVLFDAFMKHVTYKQVRSSVERIGQLGAGEFLLHAKNLPRSVLIEALDGMREVELEQLLNERSRAEQIYDELLHAFLEEKLSPSSKTLARQLDIMLFADLPGESSVS